MAYIRNEIVEFAELVIKPMVERAGLFIDPPFLEDVCDVLTDVPSGYVIIIRDRNRNVVAQVPAKEGEPYHDIAWKVADAIDNFEIFHNAVQNNMIFALAYGINATANPVPKKEENQPKLPKRRIRDKSKE